MVAQLWSLRHIHKEIVTVIVGLLFGSLGDIFLLFQSNFIFFALGVAAFLIGHLIYVPSLINLTRDLSENKITMRDVLAHSPVYIGIWMVLMTFAFWSISFIIKSLAPDQGMYVYILAVYGSCLVLLTMGGFFFFFNTSHIHSDTVFHGGLCFMFGTLIFFASDNFLAHGKFNPTFKDSPYWQSIFTYLIMITYYLAQFLVAKGTFLFAVFWEEERTQKATPLEFIG
jgi:uncharacterized membrane protein YhhN